MRCSIRALRSLRVLFSLGRSFFSLDEKGLEPAVRSPAVFFVYIYMVRIGVGVDRKIGVLGVMTSFELLYPNVSCVIIC